jgi:hypothetical protein
LTSHLSDNELQKLVDKYQKVREECDSRSKRRRRKFASGPDEGPGPQLT